MNINLSELQTAFCLVVCFYNCVDIVVAVSQNETSYFQMFVHRVEKEEIYKYL